MLANAVVWYPTKEKKKCSKILRELKNGANEIRSYYQLTMGRCEPQNATQVYLVYGTAALGLLILFAAGVPILVLANGQPMIIAGAVLIGVGGIMIIGAVVTFSIWCRQGLRSIH